MPHSNLTSILNQIDSFPALPATIIRVMEITGNPESSARELMNAIMPDQSMCAAILKIANSAFFGRPRKVCSIEEAVVVLGFDEIRNIILTQAVFNSFQKFRHTNKKDIDTLWQHSLTCGLAARIITSSTTRYSPSQLFIAGLIHDIGKLTMLIALPNHYSPSLKLAERLQLSFFPDEEEQFGISHDSVGARLLNRWLFPEQLCISTGYHHHPDTAPSHTEYALIVQMADILSQIVSGKEAISGHEILNLINDFTPESILLWKTYSFNWQAEDVEGWLKELQGLLREGASLDLFGA